MEIVHDPITYAEARKQVVKRMLLVTSDTVWQRPERMAGSIVKVWMIGGGSGGSGGYTSSTNNRSGAGGVTSFGEFEAVSGGAFVQDGAAVGFAGTLLSTGVYGSGLGASGLPGALNRNGGGGGQAGLKLIGPNPEGVANESRSATGYGAGGPAGNKAINGYNGRGGIAGDFMLDHPIDIGSATNVSITIGKGGAGGVDSSIGATYAGKKGLDGALLIAWEEIV
ncbi:hypothetical protein [Pseudomonas sp. RIT-PI-AD]|uniref:hypothetical protein n=1 Tax=Pseudomonas sp. RIT-PI-AD TaxID=3035294 RepID=UPI0021D843C6|nr:hypothetical protein [Pseudomonas sp. RIT-PI-AD]